MAVVGSEAGRGVTRLDFQGGGVRRVGMRGEEGVGMAAEVEGGAAA